MLFPAGLAGPNNLWRASAERSSTERGAIARLLSVSTWDSRGLSRATSREVVHPRCYAAPQPHPLMKSYRVRCDCGEGSGLNGGPWRRRGQGHGPAGEYSRVGQLNTTYFGICSATGGSPGLDRSHLPFENSVRTRVGIGTEGSYEHGERIGTGQPVSVLSWGRHILIGVGLSRRR